MRMFSAVFTAVSQTLLCMRFSEAMPLQWAKPMNAFQMNPELFESQESKGAIWDTEKRGLYANDKHLPCLLCLI